jgi:hypothetical protein
MNTPAVKGRARRRWTCVESMSEQPRKPHHRPRASVQRARFIPRHARAAPRPCVGVHRGRFGPPAREITHDAAPTASSSSAFLIVQ